MKTPDELRASVTLKRCVLAFTEARDEEQEHLEKVQGWYKAATLAAAGESQ